MHDVLNRLAPDGFPVRAGEGQAGGIHGMEVGAQIFTEIGQLLAKNKSLIEAEEIDTDEREDDSDGEDTFDFID